MSSRRLNSKSHDLTSFGIEDYFKVLRLFNFLSPVAADGMVETGLKLEKIGQFFPVLMQRVPNILKKFIMVSPL